MQQRFVSIWFRHLLTDWLSIRQPALKEQPFVLAVPEHGRMVITATNLLAEQQGIYAGMVAADAKAIVSGLQVIDDRPEQRAKLLKALGLWCIRYTPMVAVDLPDGLILDISGCAHLWGGEELYLKSISNTLRSKGYDVQVAMADTIGAAWAMARFEQSNTIVKCGKQTEALLHLPVIALRLESHITARLNKLGLKQIRHVIHMPRPALFRRFGPVLLSRLDQALGYENEVLQLLKPVVPYLECLPCLEPISTAKGIEIAIQQLLEMLCNRLLSEGKGLRMAVMACHRLDGKRQQIAIGTNQPTCSIPHLFKLFELKIATINSGLGIELFEMKALKVEDISPGQEALWSGSAALQNEMVVKLLDKIAGKVGQDAISRYLPVPQHWPENSFKVATSLNEKSQVEWSNGKSRPICLLKDPEPIEVSAPIPDYPPMLFRYKNQTHHIKKADGPERIEREWWLDKGEHRDYYTVEDTAGIRYWLFRSGHYSDKQANKWFIHGFFA